MYAIKNIKTGFFISKESNSRLKSVEINNCSTYRNIGAAKTMIHNLLSYQSDYEIDGKNYVDTKDLEIVEVMLVEV